MGNASKDHERGDSMEALVSKHFAPSPRPIRIEFGAISHRGRIRPTNEDHYLVVRRRRSRTVLSSNLPEGFLPESADEAYTMVVADGMGGEAFGELASMLAIRTAWDLGLSEVKWMLKVTEREVEELREKAELLFRLVDRALIQHGRVEPETAGMGTTLTIAYSVGSEAFVFHVGDSRAYLVRDGELRQLTKDHTVAQALVDAGVLTPEAVAASSLSSMLTNCVGCSKEGVRVDARHVRLLDGDRLLLCSDGLTDMLDDATIAETLRGHGDPQPASRALVELALEKGGRDNLTVVLANYSMPNPEATPPGH